LGLGLGLGLGLSLGYARIEAGCAAAD